MAYEEELRRRRDAHRRDPEREVRALTEELAKLARRRGNLIDLAADGTITRDDLRAKLSEVEKRKEEADEALEGARDRAEGMESLRRELHLVFHRAEQIRTDQLRFLDPEDKRRVLMASRTKADIDRRGNVTITGLLNLDISRLLPTEGTYRTDRDRPEPPPYERGVVSIGNVPSAASA